MTSTQDLLERAEEAENQACQAEETLEEELIIDESTEDIESAVHGALVENDLEETYSHFTQSLERALRIRAEVYLIQQSTEGLESAVLNRC
ncbi:hypothetical protein [Halorubrum sodomense]|uniref:hypothetical protein n=1 Tax=Halorubrum sodomense TaxID=35743 RepID=UPI00116038C7|nr:hypothetical protein [Halorubrum sodomense]